MVWIRNWTSAGLLDKLTDCWTSGRISGSRTDGSNFKIRGNGTTQWWDRGRVPTRMRSRPILIYIWVKWHKVRRQRSNIIIWIRRVWITVWRHSSSPSTSPSWSGTFSWSDCMKDKTSEVIGPNVAVYRFCRWGHNTKVGLITTKSSVGEGRKEGLCWVTTIIPFMVKVWILRHS